jgi:hypothetical protein
MTLSKLIIFIIGSASGRQLRGPLWSPEPSTVSSSDDLWGSITTIDTTASSSDDLWGSDVGQGSSDIWSSSISDGPPGFECLRSCPGILSDPSSDLDDDVTARLRSAAATIRDKHACTKSCSEADLAKAAETIRGALARDAVPVVNDHLDDEAWGSSTAAGSSGGLWDAETSYDSYDSVSGKIVGGHEIESDFKYPFLVKLSIQLKDTRSWSCTGSIVGKRTVLTAAHCVTNKKGERNTFKSGKVGFGRDGGSTRSIAKVHVHPDYRMTPNVVSDIAVLTLSSDIPSAAGTIAMAATTDALAHYGNGPKCWRRMPTGCHKTLSEKGSNGNGLKWFVDPHAKTAAQCTQRAAAFNNYCGRTDALTDYGLG